MFQIVDRAALLLLIGVPSKIIKSEEACKAVDAFATSISAEGQHAIQKYWQAHCSTLPKLPTVTLLDQGAHPRGLNTDDLFRVMQRLTNFELFRLWELRDVLDRHSCGYIGCPEFCLLVVLLCAETIAQRLQLLYSLKDTLYMTFLGRPGNAASLGLQYCSLLMRIEIMDMYTAAEDLDLLTAQKTELTPQEFEMLMFHLLRQQQQQQDAAAAADSKRKGGWCWPFRGRSGA